MPEVLPKLDALGLPMSPPEPRAALFWDGTHWHVPRVDGSGRVQVRGEDQLHSFAGVLAVVNAAGLSANDGYIESPPCTAGRVWHVTNIYVVNTVSALTRVTMLLRHDGADYPFQTQTIALAILEPYSWHGHVWLDPSDTIRAHLVGGINNDACSIRLTGEIMTLEV